VYEHAEKRPGGGHWPPSGQISGAWAPPHGIERIGIALILICAVGFGAIVEMRSALLKARMTDLDVYLRAAWAVRTGRDPYTITDDSGWHYHYPPLFAIALMPLADPPFGQSRRGMIPFGLAVALWYALNLLFLAFAINYLAGVLERAAAGYTTGIPPPGCRSWWSLRLLPALICIGPIGVALERGQADLLVLALLCAMIGAIVARRSFAAGWWLAGAICLKLFPLYLLVYPLWRRDWRLIASCAMGLVLGLAVIPAVVLGPAKTISYAREQNRVLIEPALFSGTNRSRAGELLGINATDSQSFVALIHRWHNLDQTITLPRDLRTRPLERWAKPAHWSIAIFLTLLTLLAAPWGRGGPPLSEELFLGSLAVIMVLSSPVSHLHYFTLALPLAIGLVMAERADGVYPDRKWLYFFAAVTACGTLPLLPGLQSLRDLGLAAFGALALWCAGTIALRRGVRPSRHNSPA
jgi:alpha-1,2-mannosyltransferase